MSLRLAAHLATNKVPLVPLQSFYLDEGNYWNDSAIVTVGGSGNDYYIRRNSMATFKFTTSDTTIVLDGVCTGGTAEVLIWVNGVYNQVVAFTANNLRQFISVTLPAGSKTVEVWNSAQNGLAQDGVFLRAVHGLVTLVPYSAPTKRVIIFGDSITQGYVTPINELYGWTSLVRQDYPGRVTSDGSGGVSMATEVFFAGSADLVAARLASEMDGTVSNTIVLAIGTNDYGLNEQSPTAFGIQYAGVIDGIHSRNPGALVYAVTMIVRVDEGANALGFTLAQYRSAISGLTSGRGWLSVLDGTTFLTLADLADGLHPNVTGHIKYKAAIKTALGY